MAIIDILKDGVVIDDCVHYSNPLSDAERSFRNGYEKGYTDGLKASKWIPIEERLPESENLEVLTCDSYGFIYTAYCRNYYGDYGELIFEDSRDSSEIDAVAWMPFPEPYQENENES